LNYIKSVYQRYTQYEKRVTILFQYTFFLWSKLSS